jgi:hypothetical protein
LILDNGDKVLGSFLEEMIPTMQDLWTKRIVVSGKAVYRPSGHLLRVDCDNVGLGENESTVWSTLPTPINGKLDAARLHRRQGPRSGMAAILGRWPGDETDEEIQAALEKLS